MFTGLYPVYLLNISLTLDLEQGLPVFYLLYGLRPLPLVSFGTGTPFIPLFTSFTVKFLLTQDLEQGSPSSV